MRTGRLGGLRSQPQLSLASIKTDDLNFCCIQKTIQLNLSIGATAGTDDDVELHQRSSREQSLTCCGNYLIKSVALRLILEDGENRG